MPGFALKTTIAGALLLAAVAYVSETSAKTTPSAAEQPDASFEEMHERAVDALEHGRLLEALRHFNVALRFAPRNAAAYYNRGNVRYLRRELDEAANDYSAALKYRPDFAPAVMNRGIVYSDLGRLDEALRDMNLAAELDPANSDVFYNRAVLYVKRGQMEAALSDYEKILRLDVHAPDIAASRHRLRIILSAIDSGKNTSQEREVHIIAEFHHARVIEQLLDITDRACIRLGDDKEGLISLAKKEGWRSVPSDLLSRGSSETTRQTGGWVLEKKLGHIALVQSESLENPTVRGCSITAKLGEAHLFEDFAIMFANKFAVPQLFISEVDGKKTSRQFITRDDNSSVDVSVFHNPASGVLLIITVHRRVE